MPKALRVLLVEDQETDSELLLAELKRLGYDVTYERVQTREGMEAALQGAPWDLVISDYSLPQFSGADAFRLCNERAIELPFIIVSGSVSEEDAVDSMRLGATDFVVKGRLTRLGPAIERSLRAFEDRRTLRATEARLQQVQKMDAIGQLAGGVAHDFNNILGVIQGYGDLLFREIPSDDRRRERVDKILSAAAKAAALTRQLLTFSRQEPLEVRAIELNALVRDVEPMYRRLISEDIQINTVLAEGLYQVKADPTQVEQVLMNLALNARDAMPRGGRLIIETSNVELDQVYALSHPDVPAGSYALLSVSDTGHGMNAETLSHMFEPFFTTKAPGKGTGLGLSTVYGIVRQGAGHIAVYSEPGRGTTFKVYLPRADQMEVLPPASLFRETLPRGHETVLLVEDEEGLRTVIRELLEEGGYTVIDGATPEASLAAAEGYAGPIHLLLTDLVMPKTSGREAAARFEAIRPGVKVLYMSGYTGAAAENHGPLEGHHAFIQKPFGLGTLLRKVRDVLAAP